MCQVDNEITRLTDAVNLLHMHLTVVDYLTKQFKQNQLTGFEVDFQFKNRLRAVFYYSSGRLAIGATASVSVGTAITALGLGLPPEIAFGSVALGLIGTAFLHWLNATVIVIVFIIIIFIIFYLFMC